MNAKRVFVVTAVLIVALFSLTSLLQTVSSAPQATTLLYDSTLGTTPDQQNFSYLAINPVFPVQASQSYSVPVTVLDTANQLSDYAGYTVTQTVMPTLSRNDGFQLSFDLRVITESHNNNDRAGFSLILLSEDLYGVEMAFWENEIWVQEGNGADLFTHAEGVLYNTITALTSYDLTIISNTYLLAANSVPLLSGSLRQYTDWVPPFMILPDPYEQPNQLFLGDDTSSAGAEVWLGDVSISTDIAPTVSVEATTVSLPEVTTQTTFIIDINTPSPLTTTVQYSVTGGTATVGQDFLDSSGTLTFTPSSLSENINLTLLPDAIPEPDETFTLTLFNVENGILGEKTSVFTIEDDDTPAYQLYLPHVNKS